MDLFDKVVNGQANLLDANTICERLDVSRTTFDRWVTKGTFPAADVKIFKSPRWQHTTVAQWLRKNSKEI